MADKSGKHPRSGAPATGSRSETSASQGAPAGAAAVSRVVVPLEDNRIVPLVLGEHDAHLALIEQLVGVKAVAHGNIISISGPAQACATAKQVLEALYGRAVRGEHFTAGDVEGMIRHSRSAPANEGMAQIRTRKKVVTARTAMQSNYIRALENTDLVFGRVVQPRSGTGTVSIANNSTTTVAASGAVALSGITTSRAVFTVDGEGGQVVTVSMPGTFDLTKGADTITVTLAPDFGATVTLSNALAAAGSKVLNVGGGFNLPSTQASGAYTGSFAVTVAYQ